jgi:hypothetical protein
MSDRCELSDLPTGQCACRNHAPKPPRDTYDFSTLTRFLARFDSDCAGCGNRMHEGDLIARTDYGEYICEECAS